MNKSQRKKLRKVASNRERQRRADAEAIKNRKPRQIRGRDRLREVARRVLRKPRTVRCVARPNRTKPRVFTVDDVVRLACRMAQSGRQAELREKIEKCVPCIEPRDDANQAAQGQLSAAIEHGAQALGSTLVQFAFAIGVVIAIGASLRAIGFILPAGLALVGGTGIRLALTRLSTLQRTMTTQQAANQTSYNIMRQHAANADVYRKLAQAGL